MQAPVLVHREPQTIEDIVIIIVPGATSGTRPRTQHHCDKDPAHHIKPPLYSKGSTAVVPG